ncbi:MAG: 7-cyano-7-deazaguanine synthase QueC [Alphaproteobacteria bacterium]
MNKKAVILLSGGLDSATVLAMATRQGYALYALSFRYGQRHMEELDHARLLAAHYKVVDHKVADIDLRVFGASALTDDAIAVPKDRPVEHAADIPVTYVPARNTIFLSYALGWAEVLKAQDIFIGVNAVDYSGYPDCRPEFIRAFQAMANLATASGVTGRPVTIHTPLIHMTKGEIIRAGLELGVDYGQTSSCYDPQDGAACGHCDACQLRLRGFADNSISDPARYRA